MDLSSTFFKFLQNFLSNGAVDLRSLRKRDDQAVGQADDGQAVMAKSPVHAMPIRAGGGGHGDLPVPDGDLIAAAVGSLHRQDPVLGQVYRGDQAAVRGDNCGPGRFHGPQKDARQQAKSHQNSQDQRPISAFHGITPFLWCIIAKTLKKSKKNIQNVLDFSFHG